MNKATIDPYLFAAFYVLFKPFTKDAHTMLDNGITTAQAVINGFNRRDASTSIADLGHEAAFKVLGEFKRQLGDRVTAHYITDFLEGLSIFTPLKEDERESYIFATCEMMDDVADAETNTRANMVDLPASHAMERNAENLITMLEGDLGELDLLRISFLNAVEPSFSIFYKYLELAVGQRTDILKNIAELLTSPQALDPYEGKLLKFGICGFGAYNQQFKPLAEWWVNTLSTDGNDEFKACFLSELVIKGSYRGALARANDVDAKLIAELALKKQSAVGCNVLFYGAGNLDIRGALVDIIDGAKLEGVFEIHKHVRAEELPGAVAVAQKLLRKDEFLVVDKADRALSRGLRKESHFFEMFGQPEPKVDTLSSDELLLSTNDPMTFWLTSNIDRISQDAVGRFLLHVEVKPASRDAKKEAIRKLTEALTLSDYARQKLLNYHEISIEQLEAAKKLSELIESTDDDRFLATIASSQKALGRDSSEEVRESVTKYDLSLLNLQGRYGPDKVIQALKKKTAATLCFYGMPGTGKTQLAEYIALQLNKPLLVKRASDIFSMWLGESEKNIAKIFEEARTQGAVLLLDEADSFLRDRALARASWEVTTVNELLTRMEHFNGIFICATNLFEALDAAALRRFTFKFQFRALDAEQRVRMFKNEVGLQLTEADDMYMDLLSLQYLTPGDFATVQRQAKIFDEELTPETWIQQLRIESKAKLAGLIRQNLVKDEGDLIKEITVRG